MRSEPQQIFLMILLVGGGLFIVGLNVRALLSRRNARREAKRVSLEDIYKSHFSNEDRDLFVAVWRSLANALKIDPELLNPETELLDYEKSYPFSDIMWDDLDEWAKAQSISEVSRKPKVVGDLVKIALDKRKREIGGKS